MVPPNGPAFGLLVVDVDPLEVVGRLGERVDPLLGDLDPVGDADLLADGGLDLLEGAEHAHVDALVDASVKVLDGQVSEPTRHLARPDPGRPQGAAARPPRRRPAPRDHRRARRARSATPLPADDAESLGRWFTESADSGSLERYLETFDHTVAVMQRADHLTRVARECVEDLAADGVVYAEVRYAPEQHLEGDLTLEEVVRGRAGRASTRAMAERRPPAGRSSYASC